MTNPVHENAGFGKCHGETGLRKVERGFPKFFCQIFEICDDFFKVECTEGTAKL